MKYLSYLFLLTVMACAPDTPAEVPEIPKRPNILFIMSDDHAERAISAYDNSLISTPNLDRIANEGMRFANSFVTNSICAPSRATMLTGLYSHLNGKLDNRDVFNGDQPTFIKDLQASGYHTSVIGKWHLKSAPQGFDYWRVLIDQGHYYNPEFVTPTDTTEIIGYTSTVITDLALEQLQQRAAGDEPFCMLYWHKAPHRNWMPDLSDLDGLLEREFPEPPTLRDDYAGRPAAEEADMRIADMYISKDLKVTPEYAPVDPGTGGHPTFKGQQNFLDLLERFTPEQRAAWDPFLDRVGESYLQAVAEDRLLEWQYQRYMQDYISSVESVDRNVGRVLDYLDESGLAENTIVIYTSDQGFYLGEHGWYDKRFMYEESMRTPLMIRYPLLVEAGTVNEELVLNNDIAPTLLDMAGVEVPERMQGASLRPLLTQQDEPDWRDAAYYHYYEYPHGWHSVNKHDGVRTDRYKLIHFYGENGEWYELYDLETDGTEVNNRFDDPALAEVQADLMQRLEELRVELEVPEVGP
ncbi:MAG: sulfatase [Bacteroidota bacterium]